MSNKTAEPTQTPSAVADAVTLDVPIQRGEQSIATVTLRRPQSGELRGINLFDLLQMNVDALFKLLPRISMPTITEPELRAMDVADFTVLAAKVTSFFVKETTPTESP